MIKKHWLNLPLLLVVTSSLSLAALNYSVSQISPSAKYGRLPFTSGTAHLKRADQNLSSGLEKVDTEKLLSISKASLRSDPLNPRALRNYSLHFRALDKTKKSFSFAKMANKLSRRDVISNLLLIENMANTKTTDPGAILRHYDIILRTNPETYTKLYPALVQVMSTNQAQEQFEYYFKRQAPWLADVMRNTLDNDNGPRGITEILLHTYPGKTVVLPQAFDSNSLFEGLFKRGEYELMKELFLRLKETEPKWLYSKDFGLSKTQRKYGPLAWSFNNSAEFGAYLVESNDQVAPLVEVLASSGSRGEVMKRILFLNPGDYSVVSNFTVNDANLNSEIRYSLYCLKDKMNINFAHDNPIFDIDLLDQDTRTPIMFTLECKSQIFKIDVVGGDSQVGMSVQMSVPNFEKK